MIRLGKVYGNLMVDVQIRSEKLRDRAERIVMDVTGASRPAARKLLSRAGGNAKVAMVMRLRGVNAAGARRLLKRSGGLLRDAISPGP
jgi:N-acetylmuramic acid 6-phosphate etherase